MGIIEYKPKYKQIKEILKDRIMNGIYKEDSKIPSEHQLVKEFNVSRHTILKALSELMGENYIYRIHGKGTFVSKSNNRRKNKIAIIVYHSENMYFSKIIRGAEDYAKEKDYHLILCNSIGDFEKETNYIEELMDEVDGFIISCRHKKEKISNGLRTLVEKKFPFVLISHIPKIKDIHRIDFVIPDNFNGTYKLTKYLIENGYERFIFITTKGSFENIEIMERFKGLKIAMKEEGLSLKNLTILKITENDPMNAYIKDGYEIAEEIVKKIKKDGKTCIICTGDGIAIGIIEGLREKGVKIPEEVGVTGFDDIEPMSNFGFKLTTCAIPLKEMGEKSAEILIEKIENKRKEPKHIILPVELKIRKTTKIKEKEEVIV